MPGRRRVNLSHDVVHLSQVGRLTEIARIPVLPGDSLSGSFGGTIQLAGFKRSLVFDVNLVVRAFYIPYRFTYGNNDVFPQGVSGSDDKPTAEQNWLEFMIDGYAREAKAHQPGAFRDADGSTAHL